MSELLIGALVLGVALLGIALRLRHWGFWGFLGLLLLFVSARLPYNARSDRLLWVSMAGIWWSPADICAVIVLVPVTLYWVLAALHGRWLTGGVLRDVSLVGALSTPIVFGSAANGMAAALTDVRRWLVLIVEAGAVSLAQSSRKWSRQRFLQEVFSC